MWLGCGLPVQAPIQHPPPRPWVDGAAADARKPQPGARRVISSQQGAETRPYANIPLPPPFRVINGKLAMIRRPETLDDHMKLFEGL